MLFLAACSESTGPAAGLRVETSRPVYSLPGESGDPSVTVDFSVRNNGSATVALPPNCGEGVASEVQRREAGAWVNVVSLPCPTFAIYAPTLLAPGEEVQGATVIAQAGQYRIRVPVDKAVGAEFSSHAVSPSFEVRWLED
jgi:hypothetical protein